MLVFEIVFIAPLSEEFFFRGVVYKFLRGKYRFFLSALITSVVFAALHGSLYGFVIIFIISFALCYLYERTGTIFSPFLFHSLHNTLGVITILLMKFTQ